MISEECTWGEEKEPASSVFKDFMIILDSHYVKPSIKLLQFVAHLIYVLFLQS
jgi:hypothetical protein